MSLDDYSRTLWKHRIGIAITAVVTAVLAGLYPVLVGVLRTTAEPNGPASAELFLVPSPTLVEMGTTVFSMNTPLYLPSLTEVGSSAIVLDPVIERLGLDIDGRELDEYLRVEVVGSSTVLRFTVADDVPDAAVVANAIVAEFQSQLNTMLPATAEGAPYVNSTVINPATTPKADDRASAASPSSVATLGIAGLALGVVLGSFVAVLRGLSSNVARDDIPSRATEPATSRQA